MVALLKESHMSFHTFPEHGIISFDFFTCGRINPNVSLNILKKEINHSCVVQREFSRDTIHHYHDIYSYKYHDNDVSYLLKTLFEQHKNDLFLF